MAQKFDSLPPHMQRMVAKQHPDAVPKKHRKLMEMAIKGEAHAAKVPAPAPRKKESDAARAFRLWLASGVVRVLPEEHGEIRIWIPGLSFASENDQVRGMKAAVFNQARAKVACMDAVMLSVREVVPAAGRRDVIVIQCGPIPEERGARARHYDAENLFSKPLVDVLVKMGFLKDDGWKHVAGVFRKYPPIGSPMEKGQVGVLVILMPERVMSGVLFGTKGVES